MTLQVAAHQVETYRVNTDLYEGPLDLLLQLIERAELDITRLALAQVTDQYLAHLRLMQQENRLNAAEVSGFLVVAARLVQIKSAALLPRLVIESSAEEEEDPGEALARQLLTYKRFKELAASLNERETNGLRTYLRVVQPNVKVEGRLDLTGVTLEHLTQAARLMLGIKPSLPGLSKVVAAPRVTIREKIHVIIERLRGMGAAYFHSLLKRKSDRLEVVVTFLAMLELIKRRVVEANQGELFGEIQLIPIGDWHESEDAALEFIE